MATKSIPQNSQSSFENVGDFMVNDDYIIISDPCYLEHLDPDSSPIAIPECMGWHDHVSTATFFEVKDKYGTRALVLTTLSLPPIALLDSKLTGTFYIVDHVGVDSGCIGIYSEGYVTEVEGVEWKQEPIEDSRGYWCGTYVGDGFYPIAVWAENGMPHTFAILLDMDYVE